MPENIATPPPKEAKKGGFKEIVKRAALAGSLLAGTSSDTLPPKVESTTPEHTTIPPASLVKEKPPKSSERFQVVPKELTAEELKIKIEDELGVVVVSPSEGIPSYRVQSLGGEWQTLDWDASSLQWLYQTLKELPDHFYKKREKGGQITPVQVILVEELEDYASLCDLCTNREVATVVVAKKLIPSEPATGEEIRQARQLTVHEFTHVVTSSRLDYYIESIAYPVGLYDDLVLRKAFSRKSPQPEEFSGEYSQLGHGAIDFGEFLSTAAQFYVEGKSMFTKIYQKYLGKERAEFLYSNVGKELFLGKEYNVGYAK